MTGGRGPELQVWGASSPGRTYLRSHHSRGSWGAGLSLESLRGKRYSEVRTGMVKGGWPWSRKYQAPGAAGAAGSKPLPTLYRWNHSPLLPSGLGGLAAHPSLLGPGKSLGSGELLMGKRNGGEGREAGHKLAVNLPEGLWGQEIHWGLGDQEDPRNRDGVSEGTTLDK